MEITLQQNAWQGFRPVTIRLPDHWEVEYHGIPGDDLPPMTKEQIKEKLNRPYGMKPLRELARGRKEVAIVFDDITRGTPTQIMAEAVLEELHAAGIQREQIRFLCALGTHGAHTRRDFVQKLGEEICHRYPIYNHNCYDNCVPIGVTSRGVEVKINKELMDCGLKIGLGALTPHVFNSFGGGGKLLFPGMASIETIVQNHTTAVEYLREHQLNSTEMMGDLRMEGMRAEIEEMTRMVGEFFKLDCIYNTRLEPVDLYAGDPIEAYYAGVPAAQRLYRTKRPADKDIVIVNANAKASEANIAISLACMGLSPKGGDIVLVDHTSLGQIPHYVFGYFGKNSGGRMCGRIFRSRPQVRRILCNMPYPDLGSAPLFGDVDKQVYLDSWEETLALLEQDYGPGTRVSVIADGTITYFAREE